MVKICGHGVALSTVLVVTAFCQLLFLFLLSQSSWYATNKSFSASKIISDLLSRQPFTSSLPSVSFDKSEVILSSFLERSSQNDDLFVTTFFLAKAVLDPYEEDDEPAVTGVDQDRISTLSQIIGNQANFEYSANGTRIGRPNYFCRIKLDGLSDSFPLIAPGYFLPSRVTSDFYSNRKVDILRCPINSTMFNLTASTARKLKNSQKSLGVELLRDDALLMQFNLPWKSRRTGFIVETTPMSSNLNAWKGSTLNSMAGKDIERDTIHLCASIYQESTLYSFLEFIEHHKLVGLDHIYLSVPLMRKSNNMKLFLNKVQNYIKEEVITVMSALDFGDGSGGLAGIYFHDYVKQVLNINSCLYLAKGNADYIGIWNVNDYLLTSPSLPLTALLTGPQVPKCFYMVQHKSILSLSLSHSTELDGEEKNMLAASTKKSYILSTEKIFQAGLNIPGACRLPVRWNGCQNQSHASRRMLHGFCSHNVSGEAYYRLRREMMESNHSAPLAFDNVLTSKHGHLLEQNEAIIYSFQQRNDLEKMDRSKSAELEPKPHFLKDADRVKTNIVEHKLSKAMLLWPVYDQTRAHSAVTWSEFRSRYMSAQNDATSGIEDATSTVQFEKLPAFAEDYSELCLGSIIERKHSSYQLHVTTFFLQHQMLYSPPEGYGLLLIRNDHHTKERWRKASISFNTTRYHRSGQRISPPRFFCRISIDISSVNVTNKTRAILQKPYVVRGTFVPNSLTVDQNANRRLDILRCPLAHARLIYESVLTTSSNDTVSVEIYREKVLIVTFQVPWRSRRTGYSLSFVEGASKFHAWKTSVSSEASDVSLHMCVPGFETAISRRSLTVFAEFFQHHILLGASHIFAAGPYAWKGDNMAFLQAAFHSYIDQGLLSFSSLTDDEEYLYSILGATFDRDNAKVFQVNMCLYLSKGVADYVAIWDNDEFFIPRPPHHTILDVLRSVDTVKPLRISSSLHRQNRSAKRLLGQSDGDGHPLCFIHFHSEVIYTATPSDHSFFSPLRNNGLRPAISSDFIGDQFSNAPEKFRTGLAFQKSILPTRKIFQAGLHTGAACSLPLEWTHCENKTKSKIAFGEEFCYESDILQYGDYQDVQDHLEEYSLKHEFDTLVENKDGRLVPKAEALIYHVQIHRYFTGCSHEGNESTENEYTKYYFPEVIRGLKRKNIYEILTANNPQSLFESNSDWGIFLIEPTKESTDLHLVANKLLRYLKPTIGRREIAPFAREKWENFDKFYESCMNTGD